MDNAVLENLKGMFEKDLIKVAYFLSRSNILHTQQRIEKVKKDDHIYYKRDNLIWFFSFI